MRKMILLLMVLAGIIGWAAAEEAPPQPARYAPGENVPLSLYLTAPRIAGLQMRLAWDPAAFEMAEETAELTAFFAEDALLAMLYAKPDEGEMTMVWMQEKDIALAEVCVLDFVLRVREDACGGETMVSLPALMLTDAEGNVLHTQADGLLVAIDAPLASTPLPQEIPAAEGTPVPAATPTPAPVEAWVWLAVTNDDADAESGQIISSRPNGSMMGEVIEPTPVPTPATVVLGSTPAPQAMDDKLYLRVTPNGENFLVELIAEDMTIAGLQATIGYDPAAAKCVSAAFADDFKAAAIIQMVNRSEAGSIKMVYSSTAGYPAAGRAIFSAEFAALSAEQPVLTLSDVKCIQVGDNASVVQLSGPQRSYTIQPMNDLAIVENNGKGAEAP
jgi:hypothetical protein